jgi:hypothetical protein
LVSNFIHRYYYADCIQNFLHADESYILGELTKHHDFDLIDLQRNSWLTQVRLLKQWLDRIHGYIAFEYAIPRMGKRIDCVLIVGGFVFAIEFKVGSDTYGRYAIDQVVDYALDLKNFHEESHHQPIVPVLIATKAIENHFVIRSFDDGVFEPILTNGDSLNTLIEQLQDSNGVSIDPEKWLNSRYKPTPTIIEAAQALYKGHNVEEISHSEAGTYNLSKTSTAILNIINETKGKQGKAICFVTGVPGAGKTLAGLNLANSWHNNETDEHAVFLSGNGPLVEVLREALARDEVEGAVKKITKKYALSKARSFIQNIHHFRDDNLSTEAPPIEHVVVFDEAQRAWSLQQTAKFMKTKKGFDDFSLSEPEFLIQVMDRHQDWATIICLIGGGQEINVGESGVIEWFHALQHRFSDWHVYVSSQLRDIEYLGESLDTVFHETPNIHICDELHLAVSVRSFRSEKVSAFVKALLDCELKTAQEIYQHIYPVYPIVLTRSLATAKQWLRTKARGSERVGLLASSGGLRLRPVGVNVKSSIGVTNWFLNGKDDVRSSYFLEEVATEFDIQGLELDWTCMAWDADMRFSTNGWELKKFKGTRWQNIKDDSNRLYLKNAYRVLLTRARQGMVIFVPEGDPDDETRLPAFYDRTYRYLLSIGISEI